MSAFALTLQRTEGVGWVTAGKLLKHFQTYDELLQYPREQVLLRIKGVPRSEAIVKRLFDQEAMRERLEEARREAAALKQRGVHVLTRWSEVWPAGLQALDRAQRPFLLYAYGHPDVLTLPSVAFFARPPIDEEPFEQAQTLTRHLLDEEVAPSTGASTGFDVVIHKIASKQNAPSMLLAHCGFSRLPSNLRPTVTAVAQAGGLFLSPFPMRHGPFKHDEKSQALILAALSDACVFVTPQRDAPSWAALCWCADHGRSTYCLGRTEAPLPEQVKFLQSKRDLRTVARAATTP